MTVMAQYECSYCFNAVVRIEASDRDDALRKLHILTQDDIVEDKKNKYYFSEFYITKEK